MPTAAQLHLASPPNPADSPGPAVSREAALAALSQLLAPALRLALRAGLKHADLDALIRDGLLSLAPELLAGTANTSQVSVLTGLHRKEVARRRAEPQALKREAARSQASLVFSRWRHRMDGAGLAATLDVADFTALAREVVKDVHPRSVLDELVRLGLVAEREGRVELLQSEFIPKGSRDDRLALMAANAADHLATGVANCTEPQSRAWLDQSIWAEGARADDCLALDERARSLWAEAQAQLFAAIEALPEAPAETPRHRVRIGMYVHTERMSP